MTDFMDVWATQWFDLQNPGQRRSAAENIVALVARQATLGPGLKPTSWLGDATLGASMMDDGTE
jgi:hypothetical protein